MGEILAFEDEIEVKMGRWMTSYIWGLEQSVDWGSLRFIRQVINLGENWCIKIHCIIFNNRDPAVFLYDM